MKVMNIYTPTNCITKYKIQKIRNTKMDRAEERKRKVNNINGRVPFHTFQ